MSIRSFALAAALAAGLAQSALAQSGATYVDAKDNIFGYGVSAPAPSGGGGGINAVTIALDPGVNRVAYITSAGSAWWTTIPGGNGPDGGFLAGTTNIDAVGPISGYAAPRSGQLVALFLDGDPTGLTAPANYAYPDAASLTLTDYSPEMRQVFFVGDGLTGEGSGTVQAFHVPDGATTLVLGIPDAYAFHGGAGWYDDNTGGFEVGYRVVPTPGSIALVGIGGLLVARRRR